MDNFNIDSDSCKCTVIHNDIINIVKEQMLTDENSYDLAEFFKVFGDPTRIKILHALSLAEMCVCDISALLGMTQSAVSHQLKVLRQARLARQRRDGKVMYYSLDDDHIRQMLNQGLEHIGENK